MEDLYAHSGRPSIDPEVFFRLQLVMFHEGIRIERELMRIVSDCLSLRWYVGYDLHEPLPAISYGLCRPSVNSLGNRSPGRRDSRSSARNPGRSSAVDGLTLRVPRIRVTFCFVAEHLKRSSGLEARLQDYGRLQGAGGASGATGYSLRGRWAGYCFRFRSNSVFGCVGPRGVHRTSDHDGSDTSEYRTARGRMGGAGTPEQR